MNSAAVLNALLGLFEAPAYLEIGVAKGVTFHAVEARHKVAVDPYFAFTDRPAPAPGCTVDYHEVASDRYFGTIADDADRFEVIFIDGLHTFEQTLRDLNNALDYLAPGGIIVVDDVVPDSYAASLPDMNDVRAVRAMLHMDDNHSWMGDVYKLVFFVDTFLQQFSYATTADNLGQLVMWRERRAAVTERAFAAVGDLQFMNCATDGAVFRRMPFAAIMERIVAARG
jgi:hypothetical protein